MRSDCAAAAQRVRGRHERRRLQRSALLTPPLVVVVALAIGVPALVVAPLRPAARSKAKGKEELAVEVSTPSPRRRPEWVGLGCALCPATGTRA